MKARKTISLLALCVLVACAPASNAVGEDTAQTPTLWWRDGNTGELLFTSQNVRVFDWDRQAMVLTRDAALDFLAWTEGGGLVQPLVVEDIDGAVHEAHFESQWSSMGVRGVAYRFPNRTRLTDGLYGAILIEEGWPDRGDDPDRDPRYDPRLLTGLEQAGVLGNITAETVAAYGLEAGAYYLKERQVEGSFGIRAEFYQDTFRIDEEVHAHFYFPRGESVPFDSIVLEITIVADDGAFRSETIEKIAASDIARRVYVYKFRPWTPARRSMKRPEPSPATLLLSVQLVKDGETIHRSAFTEKAIDIKSPRTAN